MCKYLKNNECKTCPHYQFKTQDPWDCEGEKECKIFETISTIEYVKTTPKAKVGFLIQNGREKLAMFRIKEGL